MPKYIVTCEGALEVGGKNFPTGSSVTLPEEKAASLPPGTVKLAEEAEPVEPTVEVEPAEEPDHHSKKKGNRR